VDEQSTGGVDRRTVLRGLVAGTAAAAVGASGVFAYRATRDDDSTPPEIPGDRGPSRAPGGALDEQVPQRDRDDEGYEVIGEGSREVAVTDGDELHDAIAEAEPGTKIVLASGVYSRPGGFVISDKRGTRDGGLTIEAAEQGGPVFRESASFLIRDCSHVVIRGIRHEGSVADGDQYLRHAFTMADSDHVRITRTHVVMDDASGDSIADNDYVYIEGTSERNRIDHCYFGPKTTIGTFIYIRMNDQGTQVCQLTTIDHNHFDRLSGLASSQYEPVRLGHSDAQDSSALTLFEYNLLTDCVADNEFISVKSSDNVIRYNTFRGMFGALVLRNGDRNDVYGNFWFGQRREESGGITVNDGTGHRLWNNYLFGLTAQESNRPGGVIFEVLDEQAEQVSDCVFVHNSIVDCARPLLLGRDRGSDYPYQPVGITVADNLIVSPTSPLVERDDGAEVTLAGNVLAESTVDEAVRTDAATGAVALERNGDDLVGPAPGGLPRASRRWPMVTEDAQGRPRDRAVVGALERGGTPAHSPLTPQNVGPDSP
jgi:hypothetical protein